MNESWREDALCRHRDPAWWFPPSKRHATKAMEVCRACPVQAPCLEVGLARETAGVWGGQWMSRK